MGVFMLGVIALVAVVLSFGLVALTLSRALPSGTSAPTAPYTNSAVGEDGNPTHTMARVLGELEQLSTLRERGVLTEKEFEAEKARALGVGPKLPRRNT
jgi:hypothetical protein